MYYNANGEKVREHDGKRCTTPLKTGRIGKSRSNQPA